MKIGVVCVIKESWGGSEELWAAMAHEAVAQGHQVVVSAYNCGEVHPKMQALLQKGVRIVYRRGFVKPGIPVWKRILKKLQIMILNKVSNEFNGFNIPALDCVLYNGTSYSSAIDAKLFFLLQKHKTRYYYLSHLVSDYYKPINTFDIHIIGNAFSNAAKNFFISLKTIETTERQLGISIPHASVVRNPVNMSELGVVPYPESEVMNFAMVGILVMLHKGQDLALSVLSKPQWKNRKWHLNIYGAGPDEHFLKRLAIYYGIHKNVTFHGKVSDIRKLWSVNHILLMPSLMEGMPLAVVEAMLCGRPSLLTDVGGHAEWVENDVEGFIADAPSVSSIAKTFEIAWQKRSEWKSMGENARSKALKLYIPFPGKTFLEAITKL